MLPQKILMSNLGYARGINGSLIHHVRYGHRHFYCPQPVQEKILQQLRALVEQEDPDICCFVEIDKGSLGTANFNQLDALLCEKYHFSNVENKYGAASPLRKFPLTRGKSNGFMAKRRLHYETVYFTHGTKKLIYKIILGPNLTLYFAHFSLKKPVRMQQIAQTGQLIKETPGEVIFMGDFNIHSGTGELKPLFDDGLVLLNREGEHTFRFHRTQMLLDVCLVSPGLAPRSSLRIVPQPYSDHAALLLDLQP
jgi:endonuclease/exonuclease/phosphatase family metal-dependent hydrolase